MTRKMAKVQKLFGDNEQDLRYNKEVTIRWGRIPLLHSYVVNP
jgi:hypothetical protein